MGLSFEQIKHLRATDPAAVGKALANRKRRKIIEGDGNLFILAADHPARGALAVNGNPTAMGSRRELLSRFAEALQNPKVDGVLGTPDVLEDLALMGLLEGKITVGSMNRGGLRNSVFEFDDRYTSYTAAAIKSAGIDFGKNLMRINLEDPATVRTLEKSAEVIDQCAALQIPIMLEPFMSKWVDGKAVNELTAEAVELSVAISSGLGSTSAYSWLKLPVVKEMERVMDATTLPTLLLGGEGGNDQDQAFQSWAQALALPGVKGLVVGRTLLYPKDDDVSAAVSLAANLVHK
jgi:DhnA family fructose-bisphosphate aldolase class Ia